MWPGLTFAFTHARKADAALLSFTCVHQSNASVISGTIRWFARFSGIRRAFNIDVHDAHAHGAHVVY